MAHDKREREFAALLDRRSDHLLELARRGRQRVDDLRAQAEANRDDPRFRGLLFGDRSPKGELAPDGSPWPAAPYKHVRFPERHVKRCRAMFEKLAPREGSSVFDIGAGCGYLLYFCREVRNCQITGIDIDIERQVVFKVMKELQGLQDAVFEHRVKAHEPIPFGRSYDYVAPLGPPST